LAHTAEGRLFSEEVRELLKRIDESVEKVRALVRGEYGELRVGYEPTLAVEILPPGIAAFHKSVPRAKILLYDLSRDELIARLQNATLELAIMSVTPRGLRRRRSTPNFILQVLHLRGLQRALTEFQKFAAQIVAISPQLPDNSLSTQEKDELTFAVLSDVGNKVARQFGIVFQIGEKLQKLYRKFGHPLDGAQHLPVPATFVVDGKGVIRLVHVDVDYTRRLDPDDVITTLRQLKA
jgi:peroxiredoxin